MSEATKITVATFMITHCSSDSPFISSQYTNPITKPNDNIQVNNAKLPRVVVVIVLSPIDNNFSGCQPFVVFVGVQPRM